MLRSFESWYHITRFLIKVVEGRARKERVINNVTVSHYTANVLLVAECELIAGLAF
jgi:hypothetical protein